MEVKSGKSHLPENQCAAPKTKNSIFESRTKI